MPSREPEEEDRYLGDNPRLVGLLILLLFAFSVGVLFYCLWSWGGFG